MKTEQQHKVKIHEGRSYQEHLSELKRRKPEAYKALKDPEPLACLAFNIIDLRGRKGWSQGELAERADVAPRMITYIESFSDKANTSVKVVQKIAKALGVPFKRMFQEVDLTKA
jgi:DNA-binding XRE family transcriptional regulator